MKDVTSLSEKEVAARLDSGEWTIALGDYLYDSSRKGEIELFDFEAGED